MKGVLSSNDPFYMTFGKENWQDAQTQKPKHQPKNLTPKKKTKQIFDNEIIIDRPRKLSQTLKKKHVAIQDFSKQNININVQTIRKTKPQSSMTDRHPKQFMYFATVRQEIAKKYCNDKCCKPTHKHDNIFDFELNKRLKEIETAAKVKIQRIRTASDRKKFESMYNQEVVLDKYKLVNTETMKRPKIMTINPNINRYHEEMHKLDSLINRINARISTSTPKVTTDLVKRYTLEKA